MCIVCVFVWECMCGNPQADFQQFLSCQLSQFCAFVCPLRSFCLHMSAYTSKCTHTPLRAYSYVEYVLAKRRHFHCLVFTNTRTDVTVKINNMNEHSTQLPCRFRDMLNHVGLPLPPPFPRLFKLLCLPSRRG